MSLVPSIDVALTSSSENPSWWPTIPLSPFIEAKEALTCKETGLGEKHPRLLYHEEPTVSSLAQITKLPDDSPYILLQTIPVNLEEQEDGEWIASFEEANISMSGSTVGEAMDLLTEDIEGAFELFTEEETTLSLRLQHDLITLRRYLRER